MACRTARHTARWVARCSAVAVLGASSLSLALAQGAPAAPAAAGAAAATEARVLNSALDAPLFYQLLVAEIELRNGRPAVAFELVLDAARRRKDEPLFARAVDIALQARAGDRALAAATAWREAAPASLEAVRMQLQILSAMNRVKEAAEPLRFLLQATPAAQRAALVTSLPRFFQRSPDAASVAALLQEVLAPWAGQADTNKDTRVAALSALARAWNAAGDAARALSLAQQAHETDPRAGAAVLVALELMGRQREAEAIVRSYLQRGEPDAALRMAYARALMQSQRYADAITQVQAVTVAQPDLAAAWLTLGALHVELRHGEAADKALQRYVQIATAETGRPAATAAGAAPAGAGRAAPAREADDEEDEADAQDPSLSQAWLLLSQAAELRRDFPAAEAYLARIDNPRRMVEVQTRRATLLARQGRVDQGLELLRRLPERDEDEARAKLVAQSQVLREARRWQEAFDLLGSALKRWPRDTELAYEQAMMAEKLNRLDEMERLLRGVIQARPDHQHAYNALGYSLADRGLRLAEARALILKALELAPGDPFITDSLGWVEFRLGNHAEALRLLRQAYGARPDTEIAAHLGEVLWVLGQRDEARQVWREGRGRDADNEVLRETLARLDPAL